MARRAEVTTPAHGEIWWCEAPEIGRRPVVILSRDQTIPRLRRVMVAPCTTHIRKLDSEVLLEPGDDPVRHRTVVSLDSIENVSTAVLVDRMGRLSPGRMREVCATLAVALGCAA